MNDTASQNIDAFYYRLAQAAGIDVPVAAAQRKGDRVALFLYGGRQVELSLSQAGITVEEGAGPGELAQVVEIAAPPAFQVEADPLQPASGAAADYDCRLAAPQAGGVGSPRLNPARPRKTRRQP